MVVEEIQLEWRGAVVIAHFPAHPSPEGMHVFFDRIEAWLQKAPGAVVLDALAVRAASISVRDAAGRRLKVMEPLFEESLRGQATVLNSPLVRGALATVHFFSPPKYPAKVFADLDRAIQWAEQQVSPLGRRAS